MSNSFIKAAKTRMSFRKRKVEPGNEDTPQLNVHNGLEAAGAAICSKESDDSDESNLNEVFVKPDLESKLPELLDQLRTLLKEQNFPECWRRDDEFLSIFLRVRKYNVQRALGNIRAFYHQMECSHDIIDDIRPSDFRAVYEAEIMNVLRSCCSKGTRVAIARAETWDTSQFNLHQLLQAAILLEQHAMLEVRNQLGSLTVIFDLRGVSFSQACQFTPSYLYRLALAAQESLPIKIAGIHIVNYPYFFWPIYYAAQHLIKAKIRKRLHFHGSLESLHERFGKELLPQELGGMLPMKDVVDKELMESLLRDNHDCTYYY